MKIRRFFATNSREALKLVRQELGADAVIISNNSVEGGNEILAVAGNEMASMITPAATPTPSRNSLAQAPTKSANEIKAQEVFSILSNKAESSQKPATAAKNTLPTPASSAAENMQISQVMEQMRQMQSNFESRFNELSWRETQRSEPGKKEVFKAMMSAGFGAQLSRHLSDRLPVDCSSNKLMSWLKNAISHNLPAHTDEAALLDQGGIFAFIGPTGVGKTTTVAKIAARYVMKHGTGKLALITTDSYRIGGHDQLRSYGKILGVMVHAVKDEADLKLALAEFKDKHTILIDTAGVSQRHQMVDEQNNMLRNASSNIQKILCLNASCHLDTLSDVAQAYGKTGLSGCIITKADETMSFGGVLDVVIKDQIKVYYVTNGQSVPDDIHLLNKTWLMHRTFEKNKAVDEHSILSDDELPFIMPSHVYAGASLELSHV
jgi:flagellar biosynthesis protein FlhF